MPSEIRNINADDMLKDDVSFLKVGKEVYALTPVNCDIKQTIGHIQEHFRQRVEHTLADLNLQAYRQTDEEANAEFAAITTALQRNTVSIPRDQREELRVAISNALCPVRPVQYYVTTIRGRAYNLQSDEVRAVVTKFPAFNDEFARSSNTHDICITFQTTPVAVMHYALMAGKIAVDRPTFHSFSEFVGDKRKWYKLCTGNVTAERFWGASGFMDSVRIINIDSPARREMQFDVPNRVYSIRDLLTQFTYTYQFLPIQNGRAEGWATAAATPPRGGL